MMILVMTISLLQDSIEMENQYGDNLRYNLCQTRGHGTVYIM
jgi:hypothetical protein